MSVENFTLDELARHLGRDRRELDRLASRGRIPGRKTDVGWVFNEREVTQWLERELREFSDPELQVLEASLSSGPQGDVSLRELIRPETVQIPLDARTRRSTLESLVELAGQSYQVWEPAKVLAAVQEREDALSTAFAGGVAVPHPRNPLPQSLGESVVAVGVAPRGIPFGAPDGALTDLFFLVLCRDSRTHLRALARVGRLLQVPGLLDRLRGASDAAEAHRAICEADLNFGDPKPS